VGRFRLTRMGQLNGKPEQLTQLKREAKSRFGKHEINMIRNTFNDLALRSNGGGKTASKVAFLRRFPLPGILGERLFSVFDPKGSGGIGWEAFMVGMGYILRGSDEEKDEMIFRMFDLESRDLVGERDLAMLLYSMAAIRIRSPNSRAWISEKDQVMMTEEETSASIRDAFVGIEKKTAADARISRKGRQLNREQFNAWLGRHPEVRQAVQGTFVNVIDIFAAASDYAKMRRAMKDKRKTRKGERSRSKTKERPMSQGKKNPNGALTPQRLASGGRKPKYETDSRDTIRSTGDITQVSPLFTGLAGTNRTDACRNSIAATEEGIPVVCKTCMTCIEVRFSMATGERLTASQVKFCPVCGNFLERKRRPTVQGMSHEGYLSKIGHRFRQIHERWFVIRSGFMHEFHNPKDMESVCSTFLPGCFVEAVTTDKKHGSKLKFGFEIIMKEEPRKSRLLYAQSIEERDEWIRAIKVHTIAEEPWEEYRKMEELGVGRFSSVVCAQDKTTEERFAVKVIEKLNLDEKEQEALHTEIAVLRIVRHPNILQLKNVFETRRQMFIITNVVSGGDLHERLEKEKRFSESKARVTFMKLIGVIAYLHARGVVHRDLKPENILCTAGEDFDIILGDFGLAHFAGPNQKMSLACGTPAYVAPEVWEMKGYDSQVDLWSAGVMLYLFLSGRLPFNGKDRKELQQQTQRSKLSLSPSKVWDEISEEAKDLTCKLLEKSPKKRLTADMALEHPWLAHRTACKPQHHKLSDLHSAHNTPDLPVQMKSKAQGTKRDNSTQPESKALNKREESQGLGPILKMLSQGNEVSKDQPNQASTSTGPRPRISPIDSSEKKMPGHSPLPEAVGATNR